MPQIQDALIEFNPWWKNPFSFTYHQRETYQQIKKFFPLPQIIALTGLRRVGKTTLLHKIVYDYIEEGGKPKNIIYFSFDEFKAVEMRDILSAYKKIMGKDLRSSNYLLLFDEVQKCAGWEDQLKSIYDTYKGKLKIIVSGSESLFIRRKSKETLAGRIFEFTISGLSFKEFLLFKGKDYTPIGIYKNELLTLFDEFVLSLGFPELVGIKDQEIIKKYVEESIIERVIYKDIPNLFKIRDVSLLESILKIIREEPGQMIELESLAKELKISRQTASSYIQYLEDSFLLRRAYNYSRNKRKSERKLKKYYPAIVSTNLLYKEDTFYKSKVFEWLIMTQLDSHFFWRDPYKNEVDLILGEETPKPVEIKYGQIKIKGLLAFMRKFKIREGYIVSYDKEEEISIEDKSIHVIPAPQFLLLNIKNLL